MSGLIRGFINKYSDIDIIALLRKENSFTRRRIRQISLKEQQLTSVDVDGEAHTLDAFRKKRWNKIERWSFSKAEIVFDPNGMVKQLLDEKLSVSNEFWIRWIVVCSEYLRWYCSQLSESASTMAEAWIDCSNLMSAQYCLSYPLDIML